MCKINHQSTFPETWRLPCKTILTSTGYRARRVYFIRTTASSSQLMVVCSNTGDHEHFRLWKRTMLAV
jgi:hypothetical protein